MPSDLLINRLAREISGREAPPPDDLRLAIEHMLSIACEGVIPDRPVDWPRIIADYVEMRHR